MDFMSAIQHEIEEDDVSVTENGAVGYRTTGKALLDLNFSVASLRSKSDAEIVRKFKSALDEDRIAAIRWLFFARDVRGGLGERRLFRVAVQSLSEKDVESILPLIPEYGRWDDVFCLIDKSSRINAKIAAILKTQIHMDLAAMKNKQPVSLLAKWSPSTNTSSAKTRQLAYKIRTMMDMSAQEYRQTLVSLRRYIDVTEVKMSAMHWEDIDYEKVPSRANLIYNNAFLRHDESRRRNFLSAVEKGEKKINASVLFPHDIVHQYGSRRSDATLEALWKSLPDTVNGCGNTIVVADGSGSMMSRVGGTGTSALDVANAMAIYFAERSSGQFKDKYITFSEKPQIVDMSKCASLSAKLSEARRHNECANTDIKAVFELILRTAISKHMDQSELPANILIISDMEFDRCASAGTHNNGWFSSRVKPDTKLFSVIKNEYEEAGYKLPRLVFWNVNSRTGTIPVRENELGVALVSGFSPNIAKMVMSGKTDPYECLMEAITNPRYDAVERAIQNKKEN